MKVLHLEVDYVNPKSPTSDLKQAAQANQMTARQNVHLSEGEG